MPVLSATVAEVAFHSKLSVSTIPSKEKHNIKNKRKNSAYVNSKDGDDLNGKIRAKKKLRSYAHQQYTPPLCFTQTLIFEKTSTLFETTASANFYKKRVARLKSHIVGINALITKKNLQLEEANQQKMKPSNSQAESTLVE